jgi:hypothetical protein
VGGRVWRVHRFRIKTLQFDFRSDPGGAESVTGDFAKITVSDSSAHSLITEPAPWEPPKSPCFPGKSEIRPLEESQVRDDICPG